MMVIAGCQKSEPTEFTSEAPAVISTEYRTDISSELSSELSSEALSEENTKATREPDSSEPSTQASTEVVTAKSAPATPEIKQNLLAEIPESFRQLLPVAAQLPWQSAASDSLINKYGVFKNNYVKEKAVYLTFSVNMESHQLGELISLLESKNVKASFFVLVNEFLKYRMADIPLLQKLAAQGNIVGSHGFNHYYTYRQSNEALINDIYLSVKQLSEAIGHPVTWYRPPYGFISERDLYIATGMGLRVASYSFAARDYDLGNQPAKADYLNSLKAQLGNSSVFYLHITPCNIETLGDFIDYARENGYQFLLLGESPKPVESTTEASTMTSTEATTVEASTEISTEVTTENFTEQTTSPQA